MNFCIQRFAYRVQIGAENGNVGLMSIKIDTLLEDKSCANSYRASFWLEKGRRMAAHTDAEFDSRAQDIDQMRRLCHRQP